MPDGPHLRREMASYLLYRQYSLKESSLDIRLLEIVSPEPSIDTFAAVNVRFHVVSLLDKPVYCALAYVWGDPTVIEPVNVVLRWKFCTNKNHDKPGNGIETRQVALRSNFMDSYC